MLKTTHFLRIVFAVTLFLLLVGPSCRQRPMEEYRRRLERTDKAALHAVHSERLRQIMAELERLSLNQLPQEMDVEAERQRQIGQMSPVAQAMAEAALHIPDVLEEVELSDEKLQVFVDLAEKLGNQAEELHRQAEQQSLSGVSETLESIGATCSACHSAFRVLPAVTEPSP